MPVTLVAANETEAEHRFASFDTVMFVGHVIVGAVNGAPKNICVPVDLPYVYLNTQARQVIVIPAKP